MKFIYIFLFLLFCSTTFSQEKKSTDTEIIIFDDDDEDNGSNDENPYIGSFVFKTNPFSAFFGTQFIEVEKPIFDFLSLEVGAGITFHDYISSIIQVENEYNNGRFCQSTNWPENRDYCDSYTDYSFRTTDIGLTGMAGLKLYFGNTAPDGTYLSFNMQYINKNYQVQKIDEEFSSVKRIADEFEDEIVNNLEYSIRLGWQTLHEPLISDLFLGLGIRNSRQTRQDLGFNEKGRLQNGMQTFNRNNLIVVGGFRVGLHTMKKKPKKIVNQKRKRRRK